MVDSNLGKVSLVTGAARRVGRSIARALHEEGFDLVLHCHHSQDQAQILVDEFNDSRSNSAIWIAEDLADHTGVQQLAHRSVDWKGRVDLLVNNASRFYPTELSQATEGEWNDLIASNLKGPYFLSQALANTLRANRGCIINIVDIYAYRPLANHSIYSIAKAGNAMMVKSLALDLSPEVRVNGVAPGAILWPEGAELSKEAIEQRVTKIPLGVKGKPEDIAQAVVYLSTATYVTGQILNVDGGRTLTT